jgi:hypothetical protein
LDFQPIIPVSDIKWSKDGLLDLIIAFIIKTDQVCGDTFFIPCNNGTNELDP